jgi:beta-galactosidase
MKQVLCWWTVASALGLAAVDDSASAGETSFDLDWRFLRGDAAGAERADFDDSAWRRLDVPHDWSIEDLPPVAAAAPELSVVPGTWRFHKGDDAGWKAPEFDDSAWQEVVLPGNWEQHSNYAGENIYGWFRRRLEIPAELRGKEIVLLLGRIDDADEVWLNGQRIGGTGSFPPDYRTAWDVERRYRVPATLVRGDGSDVLAVRVFDGTGNGGITTACTVATRVGPFAPGESPSGHFTGFTLGGNGWYRKRFVVNETGKQVAVRFDGVYRNPEVWLNGQRVGEHPNGYTSFEFDLTPYLNSPGQENVLAVRVRNEGRSTRWYSGSGIYRHVWLTVRESVHVPTWGVFVTTPEVSKERAVVKASVEVRNAGDAATEAIIRTRVRDAAGHEVGSAESSVTLPADETHTTECTVDLPSPELWSPDSPSLYTADVEVIVDEAAVDVASTPFGVRTIEVDAAHGFRLNGEPMELKGGCLHHDNGPLGAAAIDRAEERRVELLKENGFNAVRSSHNPPSPALLEACDRLGLLVIIDAFDQWNESKENNQQDYHQYFKEWHTRDVADMVRRDRNHPSVIMWAIGNEIPEQFRAEATAKTLREEVLAHDPTRPITAAISTDWGNVMRNWDRLSDPAFSHLDVGGYNYLPDRYESDHARHPERVMMGTESFPKDAFDYWSLVEEHPYVIGAVVWTAMDYLGEAGIGHSVLSNEPNSFFMSWPYFNAWCGDLDLCGFKKPQSYYRDVVWRRSPIEMTVHAPIPPGLTETISWWGWPNEVQSWNWTGQEGKPLQVSVFSRGDEVRLELNGKVVGEKPVSVETKLIARFDVPYAPGELRAVALKEGQEIGSTSLKTSGAAKSLRLTADRTVIRADRNDLAYVTVEVVDGDGQRVPNAEVSVRFRVSGAGELAGHAPRSPNRPASFRAPERETCEGRCLAILQPVGGPGEIVLRADADGLEPAVVTIATHE